MSCFIEFGIVWNVLFWYDSKNLSFVDHGCHIIAQGRGVRGAGLVDF